MKLPERFVWRPREVLRAMDVIPSIAVLLYPLALFGWISRLMGEAEPGEREASWWFTGYVVALAYLPVLALCALAERQARKCNWPRLRMAARILRWAHFLVAYAPLFFLFVILTLPSRWQPF